MQKIKSKKCLYGGVMFRSRTEAYWCELLNSLGFDVDYEPKSYKTSLGWYIPDFLVNGVWIEIKGTRPTEEEVAKLRDVTEQTGNKGLIISGFPKYYNGVDPHLAGATIHFLTDDKTVAMPICELFPAIKVGELHDMTLGMKINAIYRVSARPIVESIPDWMIKDAMKPNKARLKGLDNFTHHKPNIIKLITLALAKLDEINNKGKHER